MAQDKLGGIVRALVGVPQGRLFIIQHLVNRLNADVENASEFKDGLLTFVMKWKPSTISWVLDWHPAQKDGGTISGYDLERYYDGPEFTGRHLSLESPLVQDWIANPETYPEELRDKFVHLWGSRRDSDRNRNVASLFFGGGKVIVSWYWIDGPWFSNIPALLASS